MLKTAFSSKIKQIGKKFKEDTQKTRGELILDMKVLLEIANREAAILDKSGRIGKREMKAAQLAAYLARTINIIATQYDNKKIMDELKQLWKVAAELERQRQKRARKGSKRERKHKKGD